MHSNTATAVPRTGRSRRRVRLLIALLGARRGRAADPGQQPQHRRPGRPSRTPSGVRTERDVPDRRWTRKGSEDIPRKARHRHRCAVRLDRSGSPSWHRLRQQLPLERTEPGPRRQQRRAPRHWYGHMSNAWVRTGQIVQSGQPLGPVGHAGNATRCGLYFSVTGSGGARTFNASWWLNRYVGKPAPTLGLFDNSGFNLASFNTLGASHTPKGRFAGYYSRTTRQVSYLNNLNVDVVGLQEFQKKQRNLFLQRAGDTYGIYPESDKQDTENSLIWRNSTMEYLSGTTIDIPYFNGHIRKMPVVLLRHRQSGREAYFINVHNPATLRKYGNQSRWRARAIAIERAKIIELRATGRAVFLTGDLNDRARAFCPLTRGKLMLAPNSIPSMNCSMPKKYGIDWVLAAGPARFSRFTYTWAPKNLRLTDHPIVMGRAHLAPMA